MFLRNDPIGVLIRLKLCKEQKVRSVLFKMYLQHGSSAIFEKYLKVICLTASQGLIEQICIQQGKKIASDDLELQGYALSCFIGFVRWFASRVNIFLL